MIRKTSLHWHPMQQWRVVVVTTLLAATGGMGSATALAASYSQNTSTTRTLTVSQDTSVTHSLTAVTGLSDANVPLNAVLANGVFSGTAHQYGFKWENRDPSCGQSPACSRIKSNEDPSRYIDVIATFPAPADTTTHTFDGYVVVDLGAATAGQYSLLHMKADDVSAGTYQMNTNIGVYTP